MAEPNWDSGAGAWWLRPTDSGGADWLLRGMEYSARMKQQSRDNALRLSEFGLREQEGQARMKSELIDQQIKQMDIEDSETFKQAAAVQAAGGNPSPAFKRPLNQDRWEMFQLNQERVKTMRETQTLEGQAEIALRKRYNAVIDNQEGAYESLSQLKPKSHEWLTLLDDYHADLVRRQTESALNLRMAPAIARAAITGTGTEPTSKPAYDPIDPNKRTGTWFQRGPNSWVYQPLKSDLNETDKANIKRLSAKLSKLDEQLVFAQSDPKTKPETMQAIQKSITETENAMNSIQHSAPTAPPKGVTPPVSRIRVRDKVTGQTGWWEGSDAVPPNYEQIAQ